MDILFQQITSGNWVKLYTTNTFTALILDPQPKPSIKDGLSFRQYKYPIITYQNISYSVDILYRDIFMHILHDPDNYKYTKIIITPIDNNTQFQLNILFSLDRLNWLCSQLKVLPKYITELFKGGSTPTEGPINLILPDIPIAATGSTPKMPYEDNITLKLFQYQRDNVQWMYETEKNVEMNLSKFQYILLSQLLTYTLKSNNNTTHNFYIEPETYIAFSNHSINSMPEFAKESTFYGGVLSDEMGLGKTLSIVSLIIRNPYTPPKRKLILKSNISSSKISPIMKNSPNSSNSSNNSEIIKAPLKIKLLSKNNINKKDSENNSEKSSEKSSEKIETSNDNKSISTDYYNSSNCTPMPTPLAPKFKYFSKATIICCPSRLCSQWEEEIKKYVGNKLKIMILSTKVNLDKFLYDDCLTYDIIIISFSLLMPQGNYHHQTRIDLSLVKWHRVVIDEGHDVLIHQINKAKTNTKILYKTLLSIKGKYKWICTGTPFDHTLENLDAYTAYLANLDAIDDNILYKNINNETCLYIINRFFRKNTKESVKYVKIPAIVEYNKFLEFTPTERAIYDIAKTSGDETRQMQLCTSILISDVDSKIIGNRLTNITDLNTTMIDHFKSLVLDQQERLAICIKTLENLENERKTKIGQLESQIKRQSDIVSTMNKDDPHKEAATYQLTQLRDERTRTKNSIDGRTKTQEEHRIKYNKQIDYAISQIKRFTELNIDTLKLESCVICDTQYAQMAASIAVFPCGHTLCQNCTQLLFINKNNAKCCACRSEIDKNQLRFVSCIMPDKTPANTQIVSKDVNQWGTKMAYLIDSLRKVFTTSDDRVIIFSQWKVMISLVSDILNENGIKYVVCRGNVHHISASIKKFKKDPQYRVILLCSETSSSGSNLTEARIVYLLDSINSDVEHATAIEAQAIGRAARLGQDKNVEVIRLIMKNTIEEEYYNRNKDILGFTTQLNK